MRDQQAVVLVIFPLQPSPPHPFSTLSSMICTLGGSLALWLLAGFGPLRPLADPWGEENDDFFLFSSCLHCFSSIGGSVPLWPELLPSGPFSLAPALDGLQ